MKFLFLADPVDKLKPKGDSTLVLAREAMRQGVEVLWATDSDIDYIAGELGITASVVTDCAPGETAQLGRRERLRVEDLAAVFIRKDPPFDTGYVRLCWMLSLVESRVFMLNKSSLLVRYHEKLVPLEALAAGYLKPEDVIPSHLGTHESAKAWVKKQGFEKVVTKPFLGYGGNDVSLMSAAEFLASPGAHGTGVEDVLVQPFMADITKFGDRRVFFLDGEILAHFVRRPKPGGFISNLAQGGSAVSEPLPADGRAALERLGKFLKAAGIVLAGADLIGTKVSEVNITSPTGLRSLEALEGNDYAEPIVTFVRRNARERSR